MKKFFTFVLALAAAVTLNAATQVAFDFSDASVFGYTNPEKGQSTQVENGAVLSKDGVTITIAFESGNGFRFFANTNTGVVNLRAYIGSSFTIAAPEGKKLAAIAADGTNLTATYLSGGMTGANWSSETGEASLTTNVIKSTVQFNSLAITLIDEGETPPVGPENIKVDVAAAIAAGLALEDGKTSSDVYEVTGYVVNAEAYSTEHKNQIWWMADDAENTGAQEFEAYACTVSENNVQMQVLNGDKVTLTGKITKYIDKKNDNKVIIEIKNGTAVFVSKAEGDHSISGDTPPAQNLDTITVAKALEIGGALEAGKSSDVAYVIEGFVSNIVNYYDATNENETFWMAADKESTAKTNAENAFEVYRGKIDQKEEIGLHAHVFVTAKITKYQPKSGDPVIETANSPVPTVNVVEKGEVDEVIVATVAEAMAVGKALASGATTEKRYEITGYVSNVYTFYNPDYSNETVWITDDPTSTSASADDAFQIYRGKPNTKAEIGYGAKVKVTTTITNYGGTTIESASGVTIEVLEASTFVPDTLTVEEAAAAIQDLAEGTKAPKYSVVKGFIQEAGSVSSGVATYKLAQFPNESEGAVQAYKATILNADAEKLAVNNYVNVTGYLMKKNAGAQVAQGAITAFVEAPQTDTIHVNVAEAVAEGLKLPMGGKSDRIYAVTGFVNLVMEEFAAGIESFFMADETASEVNNFYAVNAAIAESVAAGAKVEVVGRLQNADGETITIENGKARYIPGEGIEHIVLTEKAQKVVVDGVIYIVRDNKMFDVRGTQVR